MPAGGLEKFDFAKAWKTEPDSCGLYDIEDGKLTIRLADGTEQSQSIKRVAGGLELDGVFTSRQKKFVANQKLEGTFSGGASVSGGGTYVASLHTMIFKQDGTYKSSRMGAVSADTAAGTVGGSSQNEVSGTYVLNGHTLELKPENGPATRHTVYPFDLGKGQTALNLDGTMLHPKK